MLMDIKRPTRFLYVQVIHVRMYIYVCNVLEMNTTDKMESMTLLFMCSSQVQIKPE